MSTLLPARKNSLREANRPIVGGMLAEGSSVRLVLFNRYFVVEFQKREGIEGRSFTVFRKNFGKSREFSVVHLIGSGGQLNQLLR